MKARLPALTLSMLILSTSLASAQPKQPAPDAPLKIHFIAGGEYSPVESMTAFKKHLEANFKVRNYAECCQVFAEKLCMRRETALNLGDTCFSRRKFADRYTLSAIRLSAVPPQGLAGRARTESGVRRGRKPISKTFVGPRRAA